LLCCARVTCLLACCETRHNWLEWVITRHARLPVNGRDLRYPPPPKKVVILKIERLCNKIAKNDYVKQNWQVTSTLRFTKQYYQSFVF
jgi:hypothetical protein